MANRHLARSTVLQTLYEWDFNNKSRAEASSILERDAVEFAPGGDVDFMKDLLVKILDKQNDIDEIIKKAAPDWPLDRISTVDRNILRIGLFELLFADKEEVPAKVAINEAIELAKTFGGNNSGKFVNGVLGTVYKEMGEPGKDAPPRASRLKKNDVPYEKMPIQKLGGAVVYAKSGSEVYLALVHDIFGHWTLSKGKVEEGENVEQGTIREIKEEIDLDIVLKEGIGHNEYIANDPEKGKIRKQVTYFLAEAPFSDVKLTSSGGLDDARWFKLKDIINLNIYEDILPIVTKAVNILLGK